MSLVPNVPPKAWSFSAIVVGYLLIDDMTSNEQNALGNWLMLAAQVLCTNAYFKQVQTERGLESSTGSVKEPTHEESILMLEKMVRALQCEVEQLKKEKI
jgi:hypothetical protein